MLTFNTKCVYSWSALSVGSDLSSFNIVLACQRKAHSCYKHSSPLVLLCLSFEKKQSPLTFCMKSSSIQTSVLQSKIQIYSRNCTKSIPICKTGTTLTYVDTHSNIHPQKMCAQCFYSQNYEGKQVALKCYGVFRWHTRSNIYSFYIWVSKLSTCIF